MLPLERLELMLRRIRPRGSSSELSIFIDKLISELTEYNNRQYREDVDQALNGDKND